MFRRFQILIVNGHWARIFEKQSNVCASLSSDKYIHVLFHLAFEILVSHSNYASEIVGIGLSFSMLLVWPDECTSPSKHQWQQSVKSATKFRTKIKAFPIEIDSIRDIHLQKWLCRFQFRIFPKSNIPLCVSTVNLRVFHILLIFRTSNGLPLS